MCAPRVASCALFACAIALPAGALAQQTAPWSLAWNAPAACPSHEAVTARVTALVGVAPSPRPALRWSVAVAAVGDAYRADLTADDEGALSSQRLDAPRCDELAETVALLLAWALQPEETPAPATPAPIQALPRPRRRRPAAPPARAPRTWSVHVGASARLDLNLLPSVSLAPAAQVGFATPSVLVELDAAWAAEQSVFVTPSRGGRFQAFTVGAWACRRWSVGVLALGPCAGVESGAVYAAGFGVSDPGEATEPWLALRAALDAEVRVAGPLHLRARLAGRAALLRPAYVLRNVGPVFQATAFGAQFDFGAVVRF